MERPVSREKKLPKELRRSLACTNIAENMMRTIRRVTRKVKCWRDAGMGRGRHDRGQQRLPTIEGRINNCRFCVRPFKLTTIA
jgi:hypothetical protein